MTSHLTKPLNDFRSSIGLPVAFGGEVAPDGSHLVIDESYGHESRGLSGLVVRAGQGLGGRAVRTGTMMAASDYLSEARITHEYDHVVATECLRSIAVVPVVVNGTVRAMLYGALRAPVDIGSAVLDDMRRVAEQAAFELTVSEEVSRRAQALEHTMAQPAKGGYAAERMGGDALAEARAELIDLAQMVGNIELRARLSAIARRLDGEGPANIPRLLSPREVDVLALVEAGLTNREIAGRLMIEQETVKSYLRSAMQRLSARNRTQAVALARSRGELAGQALLSAVLR
ncbi:LuxR C-terminal-related transcriptional regulator [Microbacterium sp. NPDC076911]|uniref:response regulator transcription factor n=1 Tax=Microbacterium sp. NPDC076911 TaxID=3154958 RepID=UPI00341535C4